MRVAPSSWIVSQLSAPGLAANAVRRALLAVALTLLLGAAPAAMAAATAAPDSEQEILRLVNRERQARGLPALVENDGLRQAARQHSERMATANKIGHQLEGELDPERRLGRKQQPFDANGENVAVAADAGRAHAALMHSPGHRANILDPEFNAVGIGVVHKGGQIFVTQDFAHLLAPSSVAEVEERVAASLTEGRKGLRRIAAPDLRRRACDMADHDRLDPRAALVSGASGSAVFTALDVTQIPRSLRSLRSRPAGSFSVGACYQSSASYGNPIYWIIVVTYPERPTRVAASAY